MKPIRGYFRSKHREEHNHVQFTMPLSFSNAQCLPAQLTGISRASYIGLSVTESNSRDTRPGNYWRAMRGTLGVTDERSWPISTYYPQTFPSNVTVLSSNQTKVFVSYPLSCTLSCTLSLIVTASRCQRKWGSRATYTNDKVGTNTSFKTSCQEVNDGLQI
jgi:hypothetical protein